MHFKLSVLALFILLFQHSIGQTGKISGYYYMYTEDYSTNKKSAGPIDVIVATRGTNYMLVGDCLDPVTNKRLKDGKKIWAIVLNDSLFINMAYSNASTSPGIYVKPEVVGRFCIAVMDQSFVSFHNKNSPNYYGLGLTGAILENSGMWGGTYLDSSGEKKKILFTDTKHLTYVIPNKGKNSGIDFLKPKTLKILAERLGEYKGSKDEYTTEEVISIVETLNARSK